MRIRSAAMIVALSATSLPAKANDSAVISLARTSKWEINYDQDSCHLLAKFGQGDQAAIMRITRFEPGSGFDLMLFGQMFSSDHPWQHSSIRFGDRPQFDAGDAGAGKTPEQLSFLILSGLRLDGDERSIDHAKRPEVSPNVEAKTNSITLPLPKGKIYRLETGSLAGPMAAMRTCTDDLVAKWGYDPAVMANLSKPASPIGDPARWITTNDFPTTALRAGLNGLIKFRLDIDETGKIKGCYVLKRFKPNEFDVLTCNLVSKRAQFTPALDALGKPVKAYHVDAVRFTIPED